MPADARLVSMTADQAQAVEAACVQMVKVNDDRASMLMALSLAYKFAQPIPTGTLTLIHGGNDDAS